MRDKIFPFLVCCMLFLGGCGTSSKIKTGDLLFVGMSADYSADNKEDMTDAIVASIGSKDTVNYFHVAILELDSAGNVWVIDATARRGVDRHPLDTLKSDFRMENGEDPIYTLMRLRGSHPVKKYVANAKTYLGQFYDLYFLPENNMLYCSELVNVSYVRNGKPLFCAAPMNFKNDKGEYPKYWQDLFARLGQPVPQGVLGTNPQDLSRSRRLREYKCHSSL